MDVKVVDGVERSAHYQSPACDARRSAEAEGGARGWEQGGHTSFPPGVEAREDSLKIVIAEMQEVLEVLGRTMGLLDGDKLEAAEEGAKVGLLARAGLGVVVEERAGVP
eukprot:5113966-Pyramimonas_sp.AAC.1